LDRTSTKAKLLITSFASAKGPSVMVIFPPDDVMWLPGSSPPVASSTPALASSSMNFPISANISASGGAPPPLVVNRNRIVVSRSASVLEVGFVGPICSNSGQPLASTSNDAARNRHVQPTFSWP
jgi:hypothetical protein